MENKELFISCATALGAETAFSTFLDMNGFSLHGEPGLYMYEQNRALIKAVAQCIDATNMTAVEHGERMDVIKLANGAFITVAKLTSLLENIVSLYMNDSHELLDELYDGLTSDDSDATSAVYENLVSKTAGAV